MPRRPANLTQSDITHDTPLFLGVAAAVAFPDGTVSAMTLRAEAARGKLAIFRIGKKYYTTLGSIEKMVAEKCRVLPKVPTSICAAGPGANQLGSSGTEGMKSAQVALQASVKMLKKGS
jgi:hypothetical protein